MLSKFDFVLILCLLLEGLGMFEILVQTVKYWIQPVIKINLQKSDLPADTYKWIVLLFEP